MHRGAMETVDVNRLAHGVKLQGSSPVAASERRWWVMPVVALLLGLSGCDQLGIETPQKQTERRMAEAKAIGGACRHAKRAIEDCYTLNPKSDKSAVYEGWREMDEYMRENNLDGIAPVVPRPSPRPRRPASEEGAGDGEESDSSAESSEASAASEPPQAAASKGV